MFGYGFLLWDAIVDDRFSAWYQYQSAIIDSLRHSESMFIKQTWLCLAEQQAA